MILLKNRELLIPEEESRIGFEGDNLAARREFLVQRGEREGMVEPSDPADGIYKLFLGFDDGSCNCLVLEKEIRGGDLILIWNIQAEHIFKAGVAEAQIKAFANEGELVWHSSKSRFVIGTSLEFSEPFENRSNSEFLDYERKLNKLLSDVQSELPYIGADGFWYLYDAETQRFEKTDISATPVMLLNAAAVPSAATAGALGQLCVNVNAHRAWICAGMSADGCVWDEIVFSKHLATYYTKAEVDRLIPTNISQLSNELFASSGFGKVYYDTAHGSILEGTVKSSSYDPTFRKGDLIVSTDTGRIGLCTEFSQWTVKIAGVTQTHYSWTVVRVGSLKTSGLKNDAGFITEQAIADKADRMLSVNALSAMADVPKGQMFECQGDVYIKLLDGAPDPEYDETADMFCRRWLKPAEVYNKNEVYSKAEADANSPLRVTGFLVAEDDDTWSCNVLTSFEEMDSAALEGRTVELCLWYEGRACFYLPLAIRVPDRMMMFACGVGVEDGVDTFVVNLSVACRPNGDANVSFCFAFTGESLPPSRVARMFGGK